MEFKFFEASKLLQQQGYKPTPFEQLVLLALEELILTQQKQQVTTDDTI